MSVVSGGLTAFIIILQELPSFFRYKSSEQEMTTLIIIDSYFVYESSACVLRGFLRGVSKGRGGEGERYCDIE